MSQADELLESVSNDITTVLADAETEPHIVIGPDRFITVPDELKRIAVQFDHDVETVTFDCPRYWDGLDMSTLGIYINYMRSDKAYGCFKVENISVDESDGSIMHFTWTVSQNVTLVAGKIQFLVCIRKANEDGFEENHWNSELCEDMYVSPGMECAEVVLEPYPDIIGQWENDVEEVKNILLKARDAGEFNGATFTPSIAEDGTLSWSNDLGHKNPDPVNIASHIDATEIEGGHRITVTDIQGSETFDIMHGISPVVEVEDTATGHRVTITDAKGSKTFEVLDGGTEVVANYMKNYVAISDTEPAAGPVLWFDTSTESAE